MISSEVEKTEDFFSIDPSEEYQFFSSKELPQKQSPMQPYIEILLQQKLTASTVSCIALMKSPSLISFYEQGFSKEIVEELLQEQREKDLSVYILEIARKNVTPEQFRLLQNELYYDILATVAKAKIAYFDFLGSFLALQNFDLALEIAEEGLALAYEVHMAGNVPDALLLLQKLSVEEATLERSKAMQRKEEKRKKLTKLLGLPSQEELFFEKTFPLLPQEILSIEKIAKEDITNNIFLKAIKETIQYKNTLSEEEKGQLWMEYARQASFVRESARSLGSNLKEAQQKSCYLQEVVKPLEDKLSFEMLKRYNAMEISPLELMNARQKELQRAVKQIQADREFFILEAEVEMLMSGAVRRDR